MEAQVAGTLHSEGVTKLRLVLQDGAKVETVVIPMRTRETGRERTTVCVSTQAGCRMGCRFCATAGMGFIRDLEPGEIIAQVRAAESLGKRPGKIVFMGMGEPLDNFDRWAEAVRELTISRRRGDLPPQAYSRRDMIVSTCGHVEGIRRLASLGWKRLTLAVSLNSVVDEVRSRLMPVNRRWPLAELRRALLDFPMRGEVFMAEYVLFRGLNDTEDDARLLAEWLRPFRACVNLIAWNPGVEGGGFESPSVKEVEAFKVRLNELGQYARRREEKGRTIAAACGQLVAQSRKGQSQASL